MARVAPRDGEPVVVKNYPNSFVQTDLDERLKAGERVEPRARRIHDAHVRELDGPRSVQPRLRADRRGRGDRDPLAARPGWRPVPAAVHASASLAAVADLFAVVVPAARTIPD